jgi:hypothetical protein
MKVFVWNSRATVGATSVRETVAGHGIELCTSEYRPEGVSSRLVRYTANKNEVLELFYVRKRKRWKCKAAIKIPIIRDHLVPTITYNYACQMCIKHKRRHGCIILRKTVINVNEFSETCY